MKYAVLYYSETGNTEMLAQAIYSSIDSYEKTIVEIDYDIDIPDADLYFIGFPVHRGSCSAKVIDCFEKIKGGKIALFATCGLQPNLKYKNKIRSAVTIWIPDDISCVGFFLCSGKTSQKGYEELLKYFSDYREEINAMVAQGNMRPDTQDILERRRFVSETIKIVGMTEEDV